MQSWSVPQSSMVETPQKVLAFLNEIVQVYEKHGLSIAHEDHHGAFVIEPDSDYNQEWLITASLNLPEQL